MAPKLLVIEDNLIQQKVYSILADRLGIESLVIADCRQACDLLREENCEVEVVMLDWCLSGECGLDWILRLKDAAAEHGSTIAVVVVTGYTADTERNRAMASGADDFLAKPFSIEDFSQVIKLWQERLSGIDSCAKRMA